MQVGDIIRFRYTGARAEILEDYLDGSFAVWLFDNQEESIAFRDDILLEKDFKGIEESTIQKTIQKKPKIKPLSTEELFYSKEELLQRKQQKFHQQAQQEDQEQEDQEKTAESKFENIELNSSAATNTGLWLAFVENAPGKYTTYLINDSLYSIRFEYELSLNQQSTQSLKQLINPYDYFPIGELAYAQLNDNPVISIYCPAFEITEQFKIKYKKWLKLPAQAPLIGIQCHCKLMLPLSRIEKVAQQKESTTLESYTRQQLREKIEADVIQRYYNKEDVNRLAHFNNEIDLHIEALNQNFKELIPSEIFAIQLLALEKYMLQAIELGVEEVFIIHGLGEGKLRDAVARQLKQLQRDKQIKEFKNEYIEKYGFGATHVRI